MIGLPSGTRIWLAAGVTDMRRGMNGLAALVQSALAEDPFSGQVFLFRGRRGDHITDPRSFGAGLSPRSADRQVIFVFCPSDSLLTGAWRPDISAAPTAITNLFECRSPSRDCRRDRAPSCRGTRHFFRGGNPILFLCTRWRACNGEYLSHKLRQQIDDFSKINCPRRLL